MEEPRQERRPEKRKLEQTASAPARATPAKVCSPGPASILVQEGEKRSVQFKLKGIFKEGSGYRDIKAVLENEHGLDVRSAWSELHT